MQGLIDPDAHAAQLLLDYARARLCEDHEAMKRAAEALHALGLHGGHIAAESLARVALDGVRELKRESV